MSTTIPEATKEERIATRQINATLATALISSATTLLVGLLAAFLGFPPFQDWVRGRVTEKPVELPQALTLEQIPQDVFAYAGNNDPAGGAATFVLIVDDQNLPNYKLDYSLPGDMQGYAGLAFNFHAGMDLSEYHAIDYTIVFDQPVNEIDLYFKDISNNFNTIRVVSNGKGEMVLRHDLSNFPTVNFNAVKEVGVVASTDFSTGTYQVLIKDVRFVE